MVLIICLPSGRHFGALTEKFSPITITTQKMANLQIALNASESSLLVSLTTLIIEATFESSHGKILTKPYYDLKDGQFAKYCHTTTLNHCFSS